MFIEAEVNQEQALLQMLFNKNEQIKAMGKEINMLQEEIKKLQEENVIDGKTEQEQSEEPV